MTPETSATAPFGNIALCLSGGGYRAATYALGTIDMLDELDLLKDVKLLSTVSGGTFTGVTYAAWISEEKSYGQFYDDLYNFLLTTNCIERALDDLYNTPSPSGSQDLSLIRSAARVYDDTLFKGRKFKPLMDKTGYGKRFLELIYNSTEFRKGNSFRFRASHNPNVNAGNGSFNVAMDIAAEIQLADIVAASSCFPAAFEPLRFPEDLYWESGLADIRSRLIQGIEIAGHKYESGFENEYGDCLSVPLMDGGIYDNQGISNAVLADEKHIFDLFLICDTSPRNDDMLHYPKPDTRDGWLTINMLFWAAVLLFIISAVSAGALIYWLIAGVDARSLSWFQIVFQYAAPIGLFFTLMGILIWGYRLFNKNKVVVVSGGKFRLWDVVRRLTLPDFINMAKARFTSLGTMASDVLLKRIRQLQFNNIMQDESRKNLVTFDLIYDLNPTKDRSDLWLLDPGLEPTKMMKKISADAEAVATTLWFDGDADLKLLIVCGQITTCFSLLKYLWRRWQAESKKGPDHPVPPKPDDPASPFHDIYVKLKAKWLELKADPYSSLHRKRV
jgi:predicted acylesterase/phospholipase RssA